MDKFKIRIIDSNEQRANGIFQALSPYCLCPKDQTLMQQYYFRINCNGLPYLEPLQVDLIFCHLSDLIDKDGFPVSQYINDCIERNIPIVLFSGGGIDIYDNDDGSLTLVQDGEEWQMKSSPLLCIVDVHVKTYADLNLEKAMPLFKQSTDKFMRQIRIKSPLMEDLNILLFTIKNPECWHDEEKHSTLYRLCMNICEQTTFQTPEAFLAMLQDLRSAPNYQAELRRLSEELFEQLAHCF